MGIFNFFNKGKSQSLPGEVVCESDSSDDISDDEFVVSGLVFKEGNLGKAAKVGHKAKDAVRAGEYDLAWSLFSEQQRIYMKHAMEQSFSAADTFTIDGSVSVDFANILRLEGKHRQALVHIIYWIVTSRFSYKTHDQKLGAYFRRCKFNNLNLCDIERFIEDSRGRPDFEAIQLMVANWGGVDP